MYNVYILRSKKKGRYYIGSTSNISRRLTSHNRNSVRSTKYKGPWEIVYCEDVETKFQAIRKEHYIKRLKGNSIFKELITKKSPSSSLV